MMHLSEAATAMAGTLFGLDAEFKSVGSDSRHVAKGELFFALKGEHFDGHLYVEDALKQGAAAVVVSDERYATENAILVKDTLLALGELAQAWRTKFSCPVIAVTGSNGKTTIKEMIVSILTTQTKDKSAVHATQGNLNNHIGLPMTVLGMKSHQKFAVLEMGMNHLEEIRYLTNIAKPTVAVIGNAGTAHIGELGSRDNIAKAKGEIFEGLAADGVAVINVDDAYADYWLGLNKGRQVLTYGLDNRAEVSLQVVGESRHMQLLTPIGKAEVKLNVLGQHNERNALAASAVALALSIPLNAVVEGLANFKGVKGRLARAQGINNSLVIDDTYNANPDSMRAAIDVLKEQAGTKLMVMGDMAELGAAAKSLHAEIGLYARESGINALYTLGELSAEAAKSFGEGAHACAELTQLIDQLTSKLDASSTVLVKGSRFMKMERVVDAIVNSSAQGAEEQSTGKAH